MPQPTHLVTLKRLRRRYPSSVVTNYLCNLNDERDIYNTAVSILFYLDLKTDYRPKAETQLMYDELLALLERKIIARDIVFLDRIKSTSYAVEICEL